MATFKICIFEHQKRTDGKFPVSIRVCWKRKYSYIKTEYYVTEKQINKKTYTLKDIFIINDLNKRIAKFEDLKSKKLGHRIEMYSVKELAEYFKNETKPGSDSTINFIEFSRTHISRLKSQGREQTSKMLNRTINALIDFCNGRDKIAITEITSKFLTQFEAYLRTERTMKRKNQFGKLVKTKKKGLSDVSIFDYMTDIRVLFNASMKEYNDEDKDEIRIIHYPFRKYKLKRKPENEKRNITVEQLRSIRDVTEQKLKDKRTIFSRDVFLLSFYMVGINFADLYEVEKLRNGRIIYERKKTKGRRQDKAYISIKVEPEAIELLEKYKDKSGRRVFDFHNKYTTSHIFSSNVNKGLKKVAEACNISEPLSTYYARHTWATVARNKCNVSKDDVDLSLNHVDQGLKMADAYIEKDWSKIDIANRKVIDYIKKGADSPLK
jgi:integrase